MDNLPSPKKYLKSRRPNKFSDSVIVKTAKLNRSMLDQHLETLTTRGQENEFAEFARKLCEFEICPNLRPQTGPVGGGDSKVDSETIPVSSQTKLNYYYGKDNQTNEQFAFAMSAKKKWTEKARSDVRKVHGLNKGYKRVYFITNQPARDKTRADIEKELQKECDLEVIILDKNWILDRIFTNKREKLAIKELEMGDGLEEVVEVGPLDLQRRKKLQELNTLIDEAISKDIITHSVINHAIDAALLAKELDDPRTEVEGLFERSIRLSRQNGNKEHLFTALYQKAWATFFWFEDFKTFVNLYDEVEALAVESSNIFSIERLSNLWSLLRAISIQPELITQESLDKKAETLRNLMENIVANESTPSASVQAEAMLCMFDITRLYDDKKDTGSQFVKLKDALDRANGLIGFPFESIVDVLTELDSVFSGIKEFEELQEHLIDIVTRRRGDIPAAELLLQRGIQHIKAKRYYKAIDCLGRSLYRFHKHESKNDLVRALVLLSGAYQDVGLLWAARGTMINAASYATSDFWVYNEINTTQLRCYERLKLLELQLGRVGASLDWHSTHIPLAAQLAKTEEERTELLDQSLHFGAILGLLLIKSEEDDLDKLEKLPDTLVDMDLDFAGMGLVYRLGGKEALPKSFIDNLRSEETDTFFSSWFSQPAQQELPDHPDYYLSNKVQLRSHTLGCNFIINTNNESPDIEIAEYIVAAIESFLSTAMKLSAAPRDSEAIINISRDESLKTDLSYEIDMKGKITINVKCGNFNPHSLSIEEQKVINSKVSDIVLHLIARVVMFADPETDLEKLFKDEEVGSRAFNFSSPLVRLGNVVGYNHRRSIKEWIDDNKKEYKYVSGKFPLTLPLKGQRKSSSPPPPDSEESLSHADLQSNSIIRMHLWDEAKWKGAFYMTSEYTAPVVGIFFTEEEPAKAIFKDWRETFGRVDQKDIIHVAVARGIDVNNPAWYRMSVGTKIDPEPSVNGRMVTVNRLHTLNAESTENLDRFVESFKKWGYYLFAPAILKEGQQMPQVFTDLGIVKHEFDDKNAWEIGPDDINFFAMITSDTNPVIPQGISNPPVMETLKRKKQFEASRNNKN